MSKTERRDIDKMLDGSLFSPVGLLAYELDVLALAVTGLRAFAELKEDDRDPARQLESVADSIKMIDIYLIHRRQLNDYRR